MAARQALDEGAFEDVDGDAPGPQLQAPLGQAALGQGGREVGVLDHLRAAVDGHHHAELLVGRDLLDHLERHLGAGLAVQAEEGGVGDLHQRVVDLEVEQRPDARARASRRGSSATPPGPGAASAVSVPPWPSGLSATRPFSARSTLPEARSTAGICPWTKNRTWSRPKWPCSAKNRAVASWFSGLVMTYSGSGRPERRPSATTFSAWIWNRLAAGDRADRDRSPSGRRTRAACPTRPRRAPRRPRRPPAPRRRPRRRGAAPTRSASVRGSRDDLDRLDPLGRRHVGGVAPDVLRDQAVELVEVDRLHLGDEPGPAVLVERAPP